MTVLVILAVAVLAIVLAIVLSDRVIAGVAEQRAAQFLTTPLGGPATVRVHGSPFLTQAIRGRYADVEVTAADCGSARCRAPPCTAQLSNVYLPLRALLGGRVTEVPCERVRGTVVLPYTRAGPRQPDPVPGPRLRRAAPAGVGGAADPRHQPAGAGQPARRCCRSPTTGVWLRMRGDRGRRHQRAEHRAQPVDAGTAVPDPLAPAALRPAHRWPRPDCGRACRARIGAGRRRFAARPRPSA